MERTRSPVPLSATLNVLPTGFTHWFYPHVALLSELTGIRYSVVLRRLLAAENVVNLLAAVPIVIIVWNVIVFFYGM